MTSFLRPYLSPLLFAAAAALVLIATAWFRPDVRFFSDPHRSDRAIGSDLIEEARAVLGEMLDELASGTAAEQGRFDEAGVLRSWTDRFRPRFAGDEFHDLGNGLHLLKTGNTAIPTFIDSTTGNRIWHQAHPFELMEGPIRFHESPVDGVVLLFGESAPFDLPVRIDSLQWRGVHVAYLVADSTTASASGLTVISHLVWIWAAIGIASMIVLMMWMRRLSNNRISAFYPIVLLVAIPEWIVPFTSGDIWTLWIRAVPYALAALLLSQILLRVKRLYGFTWYPKTIGLSVVYGSIGGFGVIGLTRMIYRISMQGPLQVLGIDIVPGTDILALYFGAALLAAALFLVLVLVGWFLMNTEADQLRWMHGFSAAGFVYSHVVGYSTGVSDDLRLLLISWTACGVIYGLAYWMHNRPHVFRQLSPFRQLFLVALLVSSFLYPIFQLATNRHYDDGLTELALRTSREGIGSTDRLGLQSPYRISLYKDGVRVEKKGDYATGQFNDRSRLYAGYTSLKQGEHIHRIVDGPFFRYQEIAARSGSTVAVVSARMPNGYNLMFAYIRLFFLVLGMALLIYPVLRLVTGNQIALFRGRERFEYRILDTYIITSFVFLVALVILSRQIIVNQSSARVELDLINTLEILSDRIETLPQADIDFFVYEDGRLTDFGETYPFDGHLPTPLLPQKVYETLYQNGQDRGVYRSDSPIGPLTVVFKKIDERLVLAVPANLNANKYMDEILQSTNFSIIVYLVIFGLFIGGTVLISREMMHPIHEFRRGLQRIAAGQLDTLIPVTSKDEIGELANAYNLMVFKLKDLQDELADKERQTAWAEMARQVAHEIKNPLTPMKLSIQHLYQQILYGDKTMDEVKPMITKISETLIREIDSLNNIANDFSKFARPITEDFTRVDVNKSVASILNLYQHDRRLYLWTDLSDEPLPVHAAPDELKRVLLNLVKNAMEALSQGGIVVIRTYRYAQHAYVEVIDNGSGIAEDLKSRIFVPNFSTKNTGTGLGLAICKKVIEAHNGRIEFASAAGLGTTFTLRFPLYTDV